MQIGRLTPKALTLIDERWQRKQASGGAIYSAAEQQAGFSGMDEAEYLSYVPCPLCGDDRYTEFHRSVVHGPAGARGALATLVANVIGRKNASALLSVLLRRKVNVGRKRYRVVRCVQCGFLFRNPTYTEKGLDRAYNRGSYAGFLKSDYSAHRQALYEHIYQRSDLVARTAHFSRRRLLDFGCGFGLFLDFMRSKGWDPHGFDFASDCIEIGRQEFGLENIRAGTLDEKAFDGDFDAVSFISVVAHLTSPVDTFSQVHRLLRPGGVVLIWTVNANSFLHRTVGEHWHGFSLNHLIFFEPRSIARALAKAGFSKVEFGYDDRLFKGLDQAGKIAAAGRNVVRDQFEQQNLGDMLVVVATK